MENILIIILGLMGLTFLMLTYLSHYENLSFGRTIPNWLCLFCLKDKIKNGKI